MNIYSIQFHSNCPTNGVRVTYNLRIEHKGTLIVEELIATIEDVESGERKFHEEIADLLAIRFPGLHRLTAHHHGVDIETVRTGTDSL